jgi:segregation and condensation protein B
MEQVDMNEHVNPEIVTDNMTDETIETTSVAIDEKNQPDETSVETPVETIDITEAKRALEAALLAASEPMAINELKRLFDGQLNPDIIRNLLDELKGEWQDRSIELAVVASGYRFRVKPEYQKYLDKLGNDKPLKYSRAVLETLAIIAYRQPVTRGDIEDIRGVAVSPHILKTLEDRGWVDEIGHRETVGRPVLFATTKHFLDDLNLRSLDELPPLHELQATMDMTQFGAALNAAQMTGTLPLSLVTDAAEVVDSDEIAASLDMPLSADEMLAAEHADDKTTMPAITPTNTPTIAPNDTPPQETNQGQPS